MNTPIPDATHPGMQDDIALENDYLLSQELADVKSAGITDIPPLVRRKRAFETFLHIPASAEAFLPTSWTITDSSPQSPVPYAAGPTVVALEATEDVLRAVVGSPQIQ